MGSTLSQEIELATWLAVLSISIIYLLIICFGSLKIHIRFCCDILNPYPEPNHAVPVTVVISDDYDSDPGSINSENTSDTPPPYDLPPTYEECIQVITETPV